MAIIIFIIAFATTQSFIWALIAVSCYLAFKYFFKRMTASKKTNQDSYKVVVDIGGQKTTYKIDASRYKAPLKKVKENVTFYENETPIQIRTINFPAYLVYVGTSNQTLPHLISERCPIGDPNTNYKANMGYWPSYDTINSTDRATYLLWLTDGRKNPGADLGLIFLYFYGLEYRAIVEKKNHLEILNELIRLYRIYARESGSFAGYCSRFIAWICTSNPQWPISNFSDLFELQKTERYLQKSLSSISLYPSYDTDREEFLFSYAQSKMMLQIPRSLESILVNFRNLFWNKVKEVKIDENSFSSSANQTYTYSTATPLRLNPDSTFSVRSLDGGVENLLRIAWRECETELAHFAQLKKNDSKLADLFLININSEQKDKFKTLLDFEDHKIFKVYELLSIFGFAEADQLSLSESKKLAEGLQLLDTFVEPDSRLTDKALKASDEVILTKVDIRLGDAERWKKILPLFDLSMAVASSEQIDEKEIKHALQFITTQFKLNLYEATRLHYRALLSYRLKNPLGPLAKKIVKSMNIQQGQVIAKFLFSIAALDGKLAPDEIENLNKIYKIFGFSEDTLDRMISEFSEQNSGLIVLKESKKTRRKGSSIPKQKLPSQPITLNDDALRQAFSEASEVSKLLADVFVESMDENGSIKPENELSDLPAGENDLLEELYKGTFPLAISDVEKLCSSKGVMYGAFLNKVNMWAEQKFGNPILEEDGEILIILKPGDLND